MEPERPVLRPGDPLPPPIPVASPFPPPVLARPATGPEEMAPRHLHPLTPLLAASVGLLRLWPLFLIAAARAAWVMLAVFAVGLTVWRALVWLRTTWSIGPEGLVLRTGILWRSVQTVPPQRVQQVEVRQALRHRATGLASVRIGLAGGGEASQVELDALSVVDADHLRVVLEQWRTVQAGSSESADAPTGTEIRIFSVETWQLLAAGFTSRSLWLAPFAALAGLVQFLTDARLDDDATDAVRDRIATASPAITIVVVMVFALFATAVSTIVSNYGLHMVRSGDDVIVRRGLVEQRSALVPRRRVQSVELATNFARDRLGLAALQIRTADLGGAASAGADSTSIPIGRREELDTVVDELFPGVRRPSSLHRHPPGAVRREVFRRSRRLVPVATVAAFVVAGFEVTVLVVAASAGLTAAVVTGWVAGRRLRSGWSVDAIVTERGALVRRRWIVPTGRIQSVAMSRDPFQRRLALATVRLDVAGTPGGVILRDLAELDAAELMQRLGGVEQPLERPHRTRNGARAVSVEAL
jgi:putative membrane protein